MISNRSWVLFLMGDFEIVSSAQNTSGAAGSPNQRHLGAVISFNADN